jgi:hypothetical protein
VAKKQLAQAFCVPNILQLYYTLLDYLVSLSNWFGLGNFGFWQAKAG